MSNETISSLLQILGGFISGLAVAWFTIKLQKERRDVEFYYSSMPLLKFKPASEPVLTVSVDESILTGNDSDKGKLKKVDDAYGFSILLRNVGNKTVESVTIKIELDEKAKILDCRTRPEPTGERAIAIERGRDQLNQLNVKIPYINVRENIDIALVSTGNEKTSYCKVSSGSKDVRVLPASRFRATLPYLVGLALLFAIVTLATNYTELLPENIVRGLGGTPITKTITEWTWPILYKVIYGAIFFLVFVFLMYGIGKRADVDLHKPWVRG
jgi:hypothetical protein